MTFGIYIKSHNTWPDFEYTVETDDRAFAVQEIYNAARGEYDKAWIRKNMEALCDQCGAPMRRTKGGYKCDYCGQNYTVKGDKSN